MAVLLGDVGTVYPGMTPQIALQCWPFLILQFIDKFGLVISLVMSNVGYYF